MTKHEPLLLELRDVVGADGVRTSPADLERYGQDWTRLHPPRPLAVCLPRSTDEVSRVLALCSREGVSVVPSGGRTGLAGGAVATAGELVLSLERMSALDDVDVVGQTVRVEAGAITEAVHEHSAKRGLLWPIDLGSKGSCQVGGNLATNAGGVRVIRYGATRRWVLGLVAVKMDGEVIRTGGALEKDNTGYDLRDLLIGSEGTLAVITEVTLKLTRLPPSPRVMLFGLDDMEAVLALLAHARGGPFVLSAFEFFEDVCLREVERCENGRSPLADRSPVYALIEAELRGDEDALLVWMEGALAYRGVRDGVSASSGAQARDLWALRENITESLARGGLVHKEDVSVPVAQLATFVVELQQMLATHVAGVELFLFGHIGDGNLHVNLRKPESMAQDAFVEHAHSVDHEIGELLARFGGSVSAEHGIGMLKKELLGFTRSDVELALFRGIKQVFDPAGLLNPGKIL